MLRLVDDIDDQRRGIDPPAAREIVLGKAAQQDRLGRDAERLRTEGRRDVERFLLRPSRGHEPISAGDARGRFLGRRPGDAHPPHAEVVAGRQPEPQRVAVEQHRAGWWPVEHDDGGGRVGPRIDRDRERPAAGEAVGVFPCDHDRRLLLDEQRWCADHGALGLELERRTASVGRTRAGSILRFDRRRRERRPCEVAAGRGGEHDLAAHDRRDAPAPHVEPEGLRTSEIVGQSDRRLERRDVGPQERLDDGTAAGVAGGERERRRLELRRHRKRIARPRRGPVGCERRREHALAADPGGGRRRPVDGVGRQRHDDRRLLAVRHDDPVRKCFEPREGVAVDGAPGREEPCPGIRRGGGQPRGDGDGHGERHRGDRRSEPHAGRRQRRAEVDLFRSLGHLADGGGAQRARLAEGAARGRLPHDLDDAQQLIPEAGKPAGHEPGDLFEAAVPPDPTMEGDRHGRTRGHGRDERGPPHPARRFPETVEEEDDEVAHEDAGHRPAGGLGELHPPDEASEVEQTLPQPVRQRNGLLGPGGGRVSRAHAAILGSCGSSTSILVRDRPERCGRERRRRSIRPCAGRSRRSSSRRRDAGESRRSAAGSSRGPATTTWASASP